MLLPKLLYYGCQHYKYYVPDWIVMSFTLHYIPFPWLGSGLLSYFEAFSWCVHTLHCKIIWMSRDFLRMIGIEWVLTNTTSRLGFGCNTWCHRHHTNIASSLRMFISSYSFKFVFISCQVIIEFYFLTQVVHFKPCFLLYWWCDCETEPRALVTLMCFFYPFTGYPSGSGIFSLCLYFSCIRCLFVSQVLGRWSCVSKALGHSFVRLSFFELWFVVFHLLWLLVMFLCLQDARLGR
jgi:hypothetical protein